METLKNLAITLLFAVVTCFWVLFGAESLPYYLENNSFLLSVSYIFTFFAFWSMWILIGTRYLNIKRN